ncbi:PepSY domain-containing protein [Tenacibaculum maritimum]|uniref:PepSY-associated TM helix domain-containing protein n=1 Tax=Tenacibaculum maritimum TaxID=107401 RepID=UPI003876426D
MKNRKLNQWIWKWHFIGGIISLPFVLVLSITGAVYLFNPDIEKKDVASFQKITQKQEQQQLLSYQKQWKLAQKASKKPLNSLIISTDSLVNTIFTSGRFGGRKNIYINPYSGETVGTFSPKDSWMYNIRKLHGELLGGKIGTKIIELVASWMVVLIITGLYVWWPFKKGINGVFLIRFKKGKQLFYRDMHAVIGFWISILLLITLAGGLPWTDIFGSNFKWVQKITNTGYPKTWSGKGLASVPAEKPITLDEMVIIAKQQQLKGITSIGLPKTSKGTFSVSNKTYDLASQKMLHFDQYSGKLIKQHNWSDVGVLMRGRMWVMAFHQGQFGTWNWWVMFSLAIILTIMSLSALASYLLRKRKGHWGVPKVPSKFKVEKGIIFILILLGVILPTFGISLILITLINTLPKKLIFSKLSSF